jgi:hypothetical protein
MIAEAFKFAIVVTDYCYAAGWARFHSGLTGSFRTIGSQVVAAVNQQMHAIVACLRTLTNKDNDNDRGAIDKALP